jgi:undecaprenyl-phosphate 4-deoxy-4-formamido-L-arabinose transferase
MVLAIAIAGYAFYGNSSETFLYRLGIIVDVVAFFSGCILARSAVAEYLAVTMAIVMGKPLYVVGSKPTRPPQ